MRCDELIRRRAPLVVIYAVQNSSHGRGAVAQHAFQAESEFSSLDFLAVLAADRSNEVGINQRSLQKVHIAEKLHLGDGEQIPRKREQRQSVGREQSLVTHIVDSKNSRYIAKRGILRILCPQQDRNQSRLPIMAMKHMRHTQNLGGFQHRP